MTSIDGVPCDRQATSFPVCSGSAAGAVFLGATTYVRLVQNSLLSAAYVIGVDQIRELYRQTTGRPRAVVDSCSPRTRPRLPP